MKRIGIFGGTFNPPHLGHHHAIMSFIEALDLDFVYVIPDRTPPHKELPPGSPSPEERLLLCRKAFSDISRVEISDIELKRDQPSYTSDTLEELRKLHPHDRLFLLVGTDMFLSFHTWHNVSDILANATLVCINRYNGGVRREELLQQKTSLEKRFNASITFIEDDVLELSSSEVREMLIFRSADTLVPSEVLNCILQKGLYSVDMPTRTLSLDELKAFSLSLHSARRRRHVAGCLETAVRYAEENGISSDDVARAAILHDVTKILSPPLHLILFQKFSVPGHPDPRASAVWHAETGAWAAREIFYEPESVVSPIRWHTTGHAGMTASEIVLYLADLLEPGRSFPGVDRLREEAERDLFSCFFSSLQHTVSYLQGQCAYIHPDSLAALSWAEQQFHHTY